MLIICKYLCEVSMIQVRVQLEVITFSVYLSNNYLITKGSTFANCVKYNKKKLIWVGHMSITMVPMIFIAIGVHSFIAHMNMSNLTMRKV